MKIFKSTEKLKKECNECPYILCSDSPIAVFNWTWNNRLVQIGKRVHQDYILSSCLFNLYAVYIMRNAGLDETQAGITIVRRSIDNLRYTDDTTFTAESEEELKSLLMKVKEESEKLA